MYTFISTCVTCTVLKSWNVHCIPTQNTYPLEENGACSLTRLPTPIYEIRVGINNSLVSAFRWRVVPRSQPHCPLTLFVRAVKRAQTSFEAHVQTLFRSYMSGGGGRARPSQRNFYGFQGVFPINFLTLVSMFQVNICTSYMICIVLLTRPHNCS